MMMGKFGCATLAALGILTASPAAAQMRALSDPVLAHPNPESLFTSKDPKLNRNKQATLHIMKELLQCNQWSRAGEWLTDKYIQHNPNAASGLAGVQHYFINVAKRQPTPTCDRLTSPIVAVQAEGDYVTVLAVRPYPYADDPSRTYTTTWFDTWRFVDGKADEHWDPATLPGSPPSPAAPAAAGKPSTYLGTPEDRAAIERLMFSYDRALDKYDVVAYGDKFTPDGSFMTFKGRDAIRKMLADIASDQQARRAKGEKIGTMHHVTTNQWLEFVDPSHARYHYYHMTVFGTGGKLSSPDAPRIAAAGNGVDDLVKVDGQWLIARRNVAAAED